MVTCLQRHWQPESMAWPSTMTSTDILAGRLLKVEQLHNKMQIFAHIAVQHIVPVGIIWCNSPFSLCFWHCCLFTFEWLFHRGLNPIIWVLVLYPISTWCEKTGRKGGFEGVLSSILMFILTLEDDSSIILLNDFIFNLLVEKYEKVPCSKPVCVAYLTLGLRKTKTSLTVHSKSVKFCWAMGKILAFHRSIISFEFLW